MKVIIDIPKELYKNKKGYLTNMDAYMICKAVKNGTPIPKGHGRLIDADALEIPSEEIISRMVIHHAPTIIEADGGETE